MTTRAEAGRLHDVRIRLLGLVRSCHPGPTLAVTALSGMLAVVADAGGATALLVVGAVFTGQLVIGWSNDLLDAPRDRAVGRADKPIATGMVSAGGVRLALAIAAGLCLVLSLWLGPAAAAAHLLLVVGSGLAYNARLKSTAGSWVPYAVAFGALPSVASLAGDSGEAAPLWMTAGGAMLGVGAHFLNALPDLADDARTGVSGLPHRLGARRSQLAATGVLTVASLAAHFGPAGPRPWWSWVALCVALLLAVVAARGVGRTPFRAAVLIALVDVLAIVLRG
jgi:4-hydroxybenzoate polyprenyltransferase